MHRFVKFKRKSKPIRPAFGVKNGILLAAVLIKYCNCVDKSFVRKGSESMYFSDQKSWRREWDSNPRGPEGPQAVRRFCSSPGLLHTWLGDPGPNAENHIQAWFIICFPKTSSKRSSASGKSAHGNRSLEPKPQRFQKPARKRHAASSRQLWISQPFEKHLSLP